MTLTDKYTLMIPIVAYREYKDRYMGPFFDNLNEEDLQRLYRFEQEIITPDDNVKVYYSDISFEYGNLLLPMIDYILENKLDGIYIKTLTQIKEIITYFQKS